MAEFQEELFLRHENERVNSIIIPRLKKIYSYEWEKISEERPCIWHDSFLSLEDEKVFDFWKNNFDIEKYIHFNNHEQIHYHLIEEKKCVPFILKFENVCGIIDRGEKEDRNHYFKPTSLLQTSYIHELFNKVEEKMMIDLNVNYRSIIDTGKFKIDSKKKLPLNQIVYFRNLIVVFEEVQRLKVRGRKKTKVVA